MGIELDASESDVLSPPCEGGVRGGGPESLECTRQPTSAPSIDEVDGTCGASPSCVACRFQTPLRANGEYTDGAGVLRPTPPNPNTVEIGASLSLLLLLGLSRTEVTRRLRLACIKDDVRCRLMERAGCVTDWRDWKSLSQVRPFAKPFTPRDESIKELAC
jgi:hypothetical protein